MLWESQSAPQGALGSLTATSPLLGKRGSGWRSSGGVSWCVCVGILDDLGVVRAALTLQLSIFSSQLSTCQLPSSVNHKIS